METFFRKLKLIFRDKVLTNRILFVLFALFIFRLLSAIPIPGIDQAALTQFTSGSQLVGLLNIFSGGGLATVSIVMLGVGPYITASIIMQLMTIVFPRIKQLYSEEGQIGRAKFTQYSRYLTVPLALIQGFSLLIILGNQGILEFVTIFERVENILVVLGGAVLMMWIGEMISEYGIGNGVSLLIFAGIVASLPTQISQFAIQYNPTQLPTYIAFLVVALVIVAGVVLVNEAERPVPVTYARQTRGGKTYGGTSTYLPLRVNQAGVMPIIFALSILIFPQLISSFLLATSSAFWISIGNALEWFVNSTWVYAFSYFLLVVLFTYFYTSVTFDPDSMSDNLQKSGAFIPGIRPGGSTRDYIANIVSRTTFFGAIFLGLIAVLPIILQQATNQQNLAIGGTALLIAVSVVLDLVKKIEAQVSMREY